MKLKILSGFLLLSVAGPLFADGVLGHDWADSLSKKIEFSDDMRGHNWGDSPAAVKKSEKGEFVNHKDNEMGFTDTIGGLSVFIVYEFSGERLVKVRWVSQESHTNKNDYIGDYNKLKEFITKKRGQPTTDEVLWRNTLYKDKPEQHGLALEKGHLGYHTKWELEGTHIFAALQIGTKAGITHLVTFTETVSSVLKKSDKQPVDDIRGHSWGDSRARVKKSEKGKFVSETGDMMGFTDTIGGISVFIVYQFSKDRLVKTSWASQEKHANKNDYISDYNKMKQLIINKRGNPKEDEVRWLNPLYKNKPEKHGLAVEKDHLVYRTRWELERTHILSGLVGGKDGITHLVEYTDASRVGKRPDDIRGHSWGDSPAEVK
jgi:hypothetical protein